MDIPRLFAIITVALALATGTAALFAGPRWRLASAILAVLTRALPSIQGSLKSSPEQAVTRIIPPEENALLGGGVLPLSSLPCWSQLRMVMPDGNPDPFQTSDCGETCVSMVVACVHGVAVSSGSIRATIHGVGGTGLTTGADLVRAFAAYHVQAATVDVQAPSLQSAVASVLAVGRPCIILGIWPTPGGALHWLLVTGAGKVMSYNNPWSGGRSWLGWDDVRRFYAGQLVDVQAFMHYDYASSPEPF
jgi:hypothetical protein